MGDCSQKARRYCGIIGGAAAAVMLVAGGCGDFFAKKQVELQTQAIINELRQVSDNENISNPVPELYRQPAEKIKVKEGVKVFYFTKHHSAESLAELLSRQFSAIKTNPKGVTTYIPRYVIAENSATNQVVYECPTEQEAEQVLEFLEKVDVPPIQVNIDCLVLERFADITLDWETTILVENLLGERITLGGKTDSSGELLPAFPGASLRETKRGQFGLDIGYWHNKGVSGHQIRAVVDILLSRGYLKVLMNPTIEAVNGETARIVSREFAPLEKILLKPGFDEPFSLTDYQWVEDILEVTPHVYSDGSIGLETKVQIGSKSKPEGVVQASIITERTIEVSENRIKPGDSLVIGGIKKTEERAVVRGVPFLKDIPILGILFSSKDFEEKGTEVIFILTPSISSGGMKYADMVEEVREKYVSPQYKAGLEEVLTDPLGTSAYTSHIEQQAAKAELERLKAEIERAEAKEEVEIVKDKLFEAAEEVMAEKARAARAGEEVAKIRRQAEALKAEAQEERAKAKEARKRLERMEAERVKETEKTQKPKGDANESKESAPAKDANSAGGQRAGDSEGR